MRLRKVNKTSRTVPRSSEYQTLPERIKFLRAKQKPYMTQVQLAVLARMHPVDVAKIENGNLSANNMTMNTLRKIAHALGCRVFINIKWKPSDAEGECQPLGPELPVLPKRTGKTSAANRRLALLNGQNPRRKDRPRKRPLPHKETSETLHLEPSGEAEKAE